MPRKKNDWLRRYKGKYASYDFGAQANKFQLEGYDYLLLINPELGKKFKDAFSEYQDTAVDGLSPLETKLSDLAVVPIREYGGDPDKAVALYDVMEEIRVFYDDYSMNLPDSAKNFKDYFDLLFCQVNFNHDDYSYIATEYDNPIFRVAPSLMGSGPLLAIGQGKNRKPVDLVKLEEGLRAPDGKGYFEPYMGICRAQNKMLKLEIQRQKNERYGWTPQSKKGFLKEYKNNLQSYIENFDNLKQCVKEHGDLYKKDVLLNNTSDELIGFTSSRDVNFVIGQMRGQVKAIENGWDLDELPLLGQVEEIIEHHEQNIRIENKKILVAQNLINKNNKELKEDREKLNQLRKDLAIIEKESYSRFRSDAGKPNAVDYFKFQFADTINAHNEYLEKYKHLKNHGGTEEQLNKLKEDNAEIISQYENYRTLLSEYTLDSQINEINKKITDLEKNIRKLELSNTSQEKTIESQKTKINNMQPKRKELAELRDVIWSKKVTNLNEKREVLALVNDYIKNTNVESTYKHSNDKVIEVINKKLTSGMDEFVESNAFVKHQTQFDLDIYGPNPKYHDGWEQSGVIKKDVFNEYFKPLDKQTREELPFTDAEIAYINMAGTLSATDAIKDHYKNAEGRSLNPDQLAIKNYSMWTEDFSSRDTGPRENVDSLKEIVKAGREIGLNAMKSYAAGDKKPLAEMMLKFMYLTQKSFDTAMDLSYGAPHYYNQLATFSRMLEKDSELYNTFAVFNARMREDERVDLDKIKQIKTVARIYSESQNDAKRLEELETNYDKTIDTFRKQNGDGELSKYKTELSNQKARLTFSAMRKSVLNMVQGSYQRYLKASPLFVEAENRMMKTLNARGDSNKAVYEQYVTNLKNSELSGVFRSVGTPEGLKDFDYFVDSLVEKYGLTYKNGATYINGQDALSSTVMDFECQKYMLECEQKQILEQISTENYKDEEMKNDLITKYMINNHQICELERGIEDGFIRTFANKNKEYEKVNYDKNKAYEERVNDYIVNMDFTGLEPSEVADQLRLGKGALDGVCKDIETIIDKELNADTLDAKQFTSIEEEVTLLSNPKKYYKKGSAQFDEIVDDLVALREKQVQAENDYRNKPGHIYDAQAFAREEKKILDKMDAYLERKDAEKKAGKDSRMSRNRVEVMTSAREKLNARFKEDLLTPDRSEERLKEAEGTANLMANGAEQLTEVSEVTGNELLEAAIFEEEHQRKEYAEQAKAHTVDEKKTERLFTSVKNTLYLQTLKAALGPQKDDTIVKKRMKDDLLKEKLKDGISPEADKQMDRLMNTKFGNELFANVVNEIMSEGADLSQDAMIVLRDQALRKCFKDAMNPANDNRKADVKEILEINQSLGSKELSKEYENYLKAQEAAKDKKAEKKGTEPENNNNKKNNQPEGMKV